MSHFEKGIASNFLCDALPGDEVKLTGPMGKVMMLPEATPASDLIMVATGTGIAPYRGFLRRLFVEETPYGAVYKGLAWLFLGVANTDSLLYDDEWQTVLKEFSDACRSCLITKEDEAAAWAHPFSLKSGQYRGAQYLSLGGGRSAAAAGPTGPWHSRRRLDAVAGAKKAMEEHPDNDTKRQIKEGLKKVLEAHQFDFSGDGDGDWQGQGGDGRRSRGHGGACGRRAVRQVGPHGRHPLGACPWTDLELFVFRRRRRDGCEF